MNIESIIQERNNKLGRFGVITSKGLAPYIGKIITLDTENGTFTFEEQKLSITHT